MFVNGCFSFCLGFELAFADYLELGTDLFRQLICKTRKVFEHQSVVAVVQKNIIVNS